MDLLGSGSLVHPGLGAGPFTDLGLGLDSVDHHGSHPGHHPHQQVHHHYNSHFYHPAYSTANLPNQPLAPHRPFTPLNSQSHQQPPGPTLTPNSGVSQPNYSPISANAVTSTSVKIKSGKNELVLHLIRSIDDLNRTYFTSLLKITLLSSFKLSESHDFFQSIDK
jgi:hypothetical protein